MHTPSSPRFAVFFRASWLFLLSLVCSVVFTQAASAQGHGPTSDDFLSHDFQWEARRVDRPQLNVHFGLSQPLLLEGFNAAMDLRVGRWVFEYSHGANLNYSGNQTIADSFGLQKDLGVTSPWTTGFGVGYTLLDELYVMAEFKAHHYDLTWRNQEADYTTISVGPTLAWRLFLWKGLNVTAYLRYWPSVWTSQDKVELSMGEETLTHQAIDLGLFANLSVGWAFDL